MTPYNQYLSHLTETCQRYEQLQWILGVTDFIRAMELEVSKKYGFFTFQQALFLSRQSFAEELIGISESTWEAETGTPIKLMPADPRHQFLTMLTGFL
jgi:hypothetical protein